MDFIEASPLILMVNAINSLRTHANLNLEYYKDIQMFLCFIVSFKLAANSLISVEAQKERTLKKVMQ